MRHLPSKYGLFEELFKNTFYPSKDLNTIALEHLLPSGLKRAKKAVNEITSSGKELTIQGELLYLYNNDRNRLSKIRNEYYQQSGERIRLTNDILKHYRDINAPKRCVKSFKKLCSLSLPDLLDFIKAIPHNCKTEKNVV